MKYSSGGRSSLAQSIGTMRRDETDSIFPTKGMPMGKYMADFYSSRNLQTISFANLTVLKQTLCATTSQL